VKIVSFNVRCIYDSVDNENNFIYRKDGIVRKIQAENPDVIGFQEVTPLIAADLKAALTEYTFLFHGRDAQYGGEGLALALRNDTMTLHTLDCFWLSETPYVAGSRYAEQSDCPRISQTAVLKHGDGTLLRISNNHLDHISDQARMLGICQVLHYLTAEQQKRQLPTFILGDFNASPEEQTIQMCKTCETLPLVDMSEQSGGTFHDFGRKEPTKIDYIFTTEKVSYTCDKWTECEKGIYLSDHYPIAVTFTL
jgi:endonuclease/exonuclease/phosphatase family metal-dependent hydrolase